MTLHLQTGAQTAAPANTDTPGVCDLMLLFATGPAWDTEHGALAARVLNLGKLRGSLSRDAAATQPSRGWSAQ